MERPHKRAESYMRLLNSHKSKPHLLGHIFLPGGDWHSFCPVPFLPHPPTYLMLDIQVIFTVYNPLPQHLLIGGHLGRHVGSPQAQVEAPLCGFQNNWPSPWECVDSLLPGERCVLLSSHPIACVMQLRDASSGVVSRGGGRGEPAVGSRVWWVRMGGPQGSKRGCPLGSLPCGLWHQQLQQLLNPA